MKQYNHIFIDLDRTLYDFDLSTRETFQELFDKFGLYERGVKPFEKFFDLYLKNNVALWEKYRKGEISKRYLNVHRFHITLLEFGIDDRAFAGRFAAEYLHRSPRKKALFPYVIEVLEYLQEKYILHIITNGFEEVQEIKIKSNELDKYFTTITTSEEAGSKKPDLQIFKFALGKAGAIPEESLMVGDDLEVDIAGAKAAGMDGLFCNFDNLSHNVKATYEVKSFAEIKEIL
jgi:putative hydrolase of the HAD superfamily